MGGSVGWIGASSRRAIRVIAVVVVSFAVLVALTVPMDQFCDGRYEAWRLPDDDRGGGCASVTPGTHAIFPWNWNGDRAIVCLGLCLDTLAPAPVRDAGS